MCYEWETIKWDTVCACCLLRQRISKIKFPMKIQNIVQIFLNFSKFVNLKAIIKRKSRKFQLIESKL